MTTLSNTPTGELSSYARTIAREIVQGFWRKSRMEEDPDQEDLMDFDDEAVEAYHRKPRFSTQKKSPPPPPRFPDRPFAARLASATLICRLIESPQDIHGLFRPGELTFLAYKGNAMGAPAAETLPRVLQAIGLRRHQAGFHEPVPVCADLGPNSASTTATRSARPALNTNIVRQSLECGRAVVSAGYELEQLEPAAQRICRRTIRLPHLDRSTVLFVLDVTHGEDSGIDYQDLFEKLPKDADLAQIDSLLLEIAFRSDTAEDVCARLCRFAEKSRAAPSVTLDSIALQPDLSGRLNGIVKELKRFQQNQAPWSQVTASALLYGPPGNGKTLIASALAGSAGVPLIATSFAQCQKCGHMGDMLKELDRIFNDAFQRAPCVLFIDELDSFCARTGQDNHNDHYMHSVVNGLLTHLTAAQSVEGLILLGATNFVDLIDPAVIRPGRFDLKLAVNAPHIDGIVRIFNASLDGAALDLSDIALRLVGQSGATIAAIARDALGRARQDENVVSLLHLEAAAEPYIGSQNRQDLDRIALHEAGHVIVGLAGGLPAPTAIQLTSTGGEVHYPRALTYTPETAKSRLSMLLAGRAAETLFCGGPSSGAGSGPRSDLAVATALAIEMESRWGFGDTALWSGLTPDRLDLATEEVRRRIQARISAAEMEAIGLLKRHEGNCRDFAKHLLRLREIKSLKLKTILTELAADMALGNTPLPDVATTLTGEHSGNTVG